MRFNDMIATVLAGSTGRPEAREAQWRQLVDLLAQRQPGAQDSARDQAFEFLRDQRGIVAPRVRAAAAASLAGLAIDPDLVLFFAQDRAEIAAPLLRSVRLDADDWLRILPRLGPTARALLRHRRDLPGDVRRALASFGPSDLVLGRDAEAEPTGTEAEPADTASGEAGSPILELVERIEAYQRQRREPTEPETGAGPTISAGPVDAFRWETGTEGVISWVEGAARGPLVGVSIATAADATQSGVDQDASHAFGRREPFRNARLHVASAEGAGGEWRASGVPVFDPARGGFLGYRGGARRAAELTSASPSAFGPALPPDALRQLIHELRTPLNAIMGFAELIEGQFMGPAADRYRTRAADIMDQASRLLGTVDDLDTAARIETQRLAETGGRSDAAALLERLRPSFDKAARQRGARLTLTVATGLPEVAVAPHVSERLLARLLAATIGLAQKGEGIAADLERATHDAREAIAFSIDRPKAVAGVDASALLDPAFTPAGDWPTAPALGLGFALRLVGNLAQAAGGELAIGDDRIQLLLPAAPNA